MKTTRCKFTCQSVTKRKHWSQPAAGSGEPVKFLYETTFTPVMGNSEENKKFFDASPSGEFRLGTHREDLFEAGKDYYIDIVQAD